MSTKKLFLLDAMALIYRAFYALNKNPRINAKGLNTSAILGFANTLFDLLNTENPSHIGVAFDTQAPTARHIDFEAYKANRQAMPDELSQAIPYIKQLIEAFDIPILFVDGYEADDVIGTLAKQAEKQGFTTYMMTPDKDFGQLVSENIFIYKPAKFGQNAEILGVEEVCAKHGIRRPEQVIDMLGLMGDSADNFPGIPGVGEVTARKLLDQFDSVENLLAHTDKIANPKLREKVETNRKLALQSYSLATIDLNVPIAFEEEKLRRSTPHFEVLKELLEELEFQSFAKRIWAKPESFWRGNIDSTPAPGRRDARPYVSTGPHEGRDARPSISTPPPFDLFNPYVERPPSLQTPKNNAYDPARTSYTLIEDLPAFVQILLQQKSFCFDTETTHLQPMDADLVGIAFCFEAHKAYFLHLPDKEESVQQALEMLRPVWENEEIEKVGQNLKYDLHVLLRYGFRVKGPLFDTLIAHYVLEPERRASLDVLAKAYLDYHCIPIEELIGKKGNKQGNMRHVELEKLLPYACEDADITWQIREKLLPLIQEKKANKLLQEIEFPLIPVLVDLEASGVQLDRQMLANFSRDLSVELKKTEEAIHQLAGIEFNIASPKQLGEVLFDRLQLSEKSKKTSSTQQHSTAEEVLQKLIHVHPIVQCVLDYRSLSKLKSTYVDALPSLVSPRSGRLHTSFNQAVTATGRLSSSHPNLQNIPIRTELGREIRKAFIPRSEDYVLMAADYSQIELRIIASISEDEGMMDDFRAGHDIHLATAAKIYNCSMDDVDKEMRRKAKSINFGIIYGMSAFGLSEQLAITRSEASQMIQQYFEKYPRIAQYMSRAVSDAKAKGYAETLCGRRRYLPDLQAKNANIRAFAERNAINAPIQGSSADMIKIAMIHIHQQLHDKKLRSQMTLQVHDELVFDVHKEEIETVQHLVVDAMKKALSLKVPVVVEASLGNNWLEAH